MNLRNSDPTEAPRPEVLQASDPYLDTEILVNDFLNGAVPHPFDLDWEA